MALKGLLEDPGFVSIFTPHVGDNKRDWACVVLALVQAMPSEQVLTYLDLHAILAQHGAHHEAAQA